MEAVLAMPSPERGRAFVLPLSMADVGVRAVVHTGAQLLTEIGREQPEAVLLPESLHDGRAEMWLAKIAASVARRPYAIVLVFGVEGSESIRERVRSAYGPTVEVVAAGARSTEEIAAEAGRLLQRMASLMADQDKDAFARLRQDVPTATVPQPVRKGGAIAFLGVSGGVGTSTLVSNLALFAAMAGQRVLVVDADFAAAGGVLHHLGTIPDDHNFGVHHLKWGYMSATASGSREVPAEELLVRLQDVRVRNVRHADLKVLHVPAILDHMMNLPAEQVVWAIRTLERQFDLVLVDCGSGVGSDRTPKLLADSSHLFLVTAGSGASVHALVRTLTALDGNGLRERLFLILREGAEGAYGPRTVSSTAGMPIYGRLPDEPQLRKADSRLGVRIPLVAESPESAYVAGVANLAYSLGLVAQTERQTRGERRPWFRFASRGT